MNSENEIDYRIFHDYIYHGFGSESAQKQMVNALFAFCKNEIEKEKENNDEKIPVDLFHYTLSIDSFQYVAKIGEQVHDAFYFKDCSDYPYPPTPEQKERFHNINNKLMELLSEATKDH